MIDPAIIGGAVAIVVVVAAMIAIISLARMSGKADAENDELEDEVELLRRIQDDANKPLPDDPAAAAKLLRDS